MEVASLIGCGLQAFSVPVVLLAYWCGAAPQAVLLAMLAAFVAVMAQVLTGLVFAAAGGDRQESGGDAASPVLVVVLGVAFQEALRVALAVALFHAEAAFERHCQSLSGSRFHTSFIGFACGIGHGTAAALLGFGTALNTGFTLAFGGAAAFDLARCPQIPALQSAALSGCMVVLCNGAWSVLVHQSVAGILEHRGTGLPALLGGMIGSAAAAGTVSDEDDDEASRADRARPSRSTGPAPREADGDASREMQPLVSPSTGASTSLAARVCRQPPRPRALRPQSELSQTQGMLVVATTCVLHFVFSAASLVTKPAYYLETGVAGSAGCRHSLPLQVGATAFSILLAAILAWNDRL